MRILLVLIATLILGAVSAAAGNLVDVSVVSRSDHQSLTMYPHQGKTYVAGQPGEYYSLRVVNRSGKRLLFVMSVDGVNVISGQTAGTEQSGYVLDPGGIGEITGWRKSSDEVAGFYFTRLPDSYAARTDRPANVGVIGVAVFREYEEPRPVPVAPSTTAQKQTAGTADLSQTESQGAGGDSADAASSAVQRAPIPQKQERLGTGHGEREASHITYTSFRRAGSHPDEEVAIYYDSHDNLVAGGVIPRRPPVTPEPRPFPNSDFVPDPHK
jgi:hypothetical protein